MKGGNGPVMLKDEVDVHSPIRSWENGKKVVIPYAADAYDTLRQTWFTLLTGGTGYNTDDSNIAAALATINQNAQASWSMLNTATGRTYLGLI